MSWQNLRKFLAQGAGGSPRNIQAAVVDQILDFVAGQREICERFESDFMSLGNALQAVAIDAAELTRQTVGAIGLLGKEDAGVMADLRRLAEESLQELRGRTLVIGHNLQVVQTIFAELDRLVTQAETLQKLGLYLGVVGLNIGVESTRTVTAAGMFSGVAQEVRQLAAKIRQVATEIAADCEKEQQGQQAVGDRIAQSLAVLTGLAQEAELAVEEAVGCIEEIMGKALAALAEANEHASAISSQIGEIVMMIQLHDSMSQRIAHIVEALIMVGDTLKQADGHAQPERLQSLAVARRLILLQAGQIELIIKETAEANRKSRLAFQAIDQRVAALGHCFSVLSAGAGNEQGSAASEPLSLLQTALGRLSRLLAEGSTMIGQLNDSARQTLLMAGRLVGHMKDIQTIRFEVHTKALNTIIMAAHLGTQGTTMEVLARETKLLSDQAHGFVGEMTAIHGGIAESVQALQIEDHGRIAGKQGGEMLDSAVGLIAETMGRFNRESAAAGNQAEVLRTTIARAGDGLEFLDRLAAELSDQQRQLATIAELISPLVAQLDSGAALDEDSRLQALYTMDKERQLHAAMLGADGAGPQKDGEEAAVAGGGDDRLPLVEVPPAPPAAAKNQDDNIELF